MRKADAVIERVEIDGKVKLFLHASRYEILYKHSEVKTVDLTAKDLRRYQGLGDTGKTILLGKWWAR